MSARACQRNPTINGDKRPKYGMVVTPEGAVKFARLRREDLLRGETSEGPIQRVLATTEPLASITEDDFFRFGGSHGTWNLETAQGLMGGASGAPDWKRGDRLRVEAGGQKLSVDIIGSDADVAAMKALDDHCFGEHQGISVEALEHIRDNGFLSLIRDAEGNPIAEGQTVTRAVASAEESIVRALPADVGYAEGTAVAPEHRRSASGSAVGLAIRKSRMEALRQMGKKGAFATVRVENPASIRGLMDVGFMLTAYHPTYYGEDQPRAVLYANLRHPEVSKKATTWVSVNAGDELDVSANEEVRRLMNEEGMVGVTMRRGADGRAEIGFMPSADLPENLRPDVERRAAWARRNAGVKTRASLVQLTGNMTTDDDRPVVGKRDRARVFDDILSERFEELLSARPDSSARVRPEEAVQLAQAFERQMSAELAQTSPTNAPSRPFTKAAQGQLRDQLEEVAGAMEARARDLEWGASVQELFAALHPEQWRR